MRVFILKKMQFTNRVTTITQDVILPKAIDTVLGDNFITFRFLSNGQKWNGHTMSRPLKVAKSELGGSFSGLDTHSTSTVETRVKMDYDLRGYEMPIAIPGMEKAVNRTEAEVINLVKIEIESSQDDALDDIGTMLYADGTGNANKDFLGLDALNDDGSTVDEIGGLSRTDYPTLAGYHVSSGGAMTLKKIAALVSGVSAGSSARSRPTFFGSDEDVWDLYETLLSPTVNANYNAFGYPVVTRNSRGAIRASELGGSYGFTAVTYRGIPWIADEKSTSETLWAMNENYLTWYGLNDPDLKSISLGQDIDGPYADIPSKNVGFQWTGFMRPINQYGEVAHIYLLGNFTCWNPKRQGRLDDITTV